MGAKKSAKDYEKVGRMMEDIVLSSTGNYKKLIWYNFVKGLAYGFGIFLAGTIVVGLVVWILGLFDNAPIIGPLVQNIVDNLKK